MHQVLEPDRLTAFLAPTQLNPPHSIASATQNIELICEEITKSDKLPSAEALRLAIVAYRDHPPQDVSYVTKTLPFTSAVPEVKEFLKSLYASGGGDGPEAVTAAMKACLDLDWRPNSSKMVVLIADAPPHGIGEYGDGFASGSPDGEWVAHTGGFPAAMFRAIRPVQKRADGRKRSSARLQAPTLFNWHASWRRRGSPL